MKNEGKIPFFSQFDMGIKYCAGIAAIVLVIYGVFLAVAYLLSSQWFFFWVAVLEAILIILFLLSNLPDKSGRR